MDPATLGVLSLAGSAGQAIFGAVGASQSAEASAKATQYQAQVARNNQIIAQNNAQYAVSAGDAAAQRADMKTRAVAGAIEAAQGASGIDLNSPTSKNVRDSALQIGRLDAETIRSNADLTARSYEATAVNQGAQAGLSDMAARSERSAGTTGAFASLISGASSFADKWARYKIPTTGTIF